SSPFCAGAAACGLGAASAAAGAAAPAAPSSSARSVPLLTLSPTLTFSSLMTPACDDGISIDALSLSTVTSDCSCFTVSPGLTKTSMTDTSAKSPMSGTTTSTVPPALLALPLAGGGWGEGGGGALGVGGGAAAASPAAASPWASSISTDAPSPTLSPSLTFSSFTTPACD